METPEEKQQDQKGADIIGRMLKTRTILVCGEVDQEMAERVIGQLVVLDAESHDPIRVFITSQGGHLDSGFAIHDMMRFVHSKIICIGAGWVASIAVPILFGAKKEDRFALPNTRFLLHQPTKGVEGHLSDIRIEAQELLRVRQRINELVAAETGQSVEKVTKDSDRDFWMTAEEAKEYGLICRIVSRADEVT